MTYQPTGVFVPLITPFTDNGQIHTDDLRRLATQVLADGASGIVALGTTGEAASLTDNERRIVVEICGTVCESADAPLIVGAGTNDTVGSVAAINEIVASADVAAILAVVPYYTQPTQAGVVAHFEYLAQHTDVPLVIYNVPYRTGQQLDSDAILSLARSEQFVGVKQAVGAVDTDTALLISAAPEGFSILAGEDTLVSAMFALGAQGTIAAVANVLTSEFVELFTLWQAGQIGDARQLGHRLVTPAQALMSRPNPVGIKAALHEQGRISSDAVRLPLVT